MADICPRTSLPQSLVPEGLVCIGCGYQNSGASSSSVPQNASTGQQLIAQRPQAAGVQLPPPAVQLPRDLAENAFGKALKGKAKEREKSVEMPHSPGNGTRCSNSNNISLHPSPRRQRTLRRCPPPPPHLVPPPSRPSHSDSSYLQRLPHHRISIMRVALKAVSGFPHHVPTQ
jgi:hypothetical protein